MTCYVCFHLTTYKEDMRCIHCGEPIGPPWWSRIIWSVRRELGGPEALVFTGLRIVMGSLGLLTGRLVTAHIHDWLGHVISGLGFLVLMLGLWGLIIPVERGLLGPVVRRIRARFNWQ